MSARIPPVIYLPGAGGGAPDLTLLNADGATPTTFEIIKYPGWQRYSAGDFTAERLIAEIAAHIIAVVPEGPLHLIGLSIGAHFGYAAALQLQRQGRPIAGFCAIDAFMVSSAAPGAGWKGRALKEAAELLRKRRFREMTVFVRSKFWRAILRILGNRVAGLVQGLSSRGTKAAMESVLEGELSMRMLLRETAPWIPTLDRGNETLRAPSVLLRTRHTADDDAAWRRRCSDLQIVEVPGGHHTLFEPEHIDPLRRAFLASTAHWR